LASNFKVTAISRAESTTSFTDPAVTVVKGSYGDASFLKSVFATQDALVFAVGSGSLQAQTDIIDAAVAAGVKRIIPSEFGSVLFASSYP
jgi:uncharacterized protein YbjT (DUF2867 family)